MSFREGWLEAASWLEEYKGELGKQLAEEMRTRFPEEPTPLEEIKAGIQRWATGQYEGEKISVLVDTALVLVELIGVDNEGETFRRITYIVPTDNWSLSSGLGLASAAEYFTRRDVLGEGN